MWDFISPDDLGNAGSVDWLSTGDRVARLGTISFVRSGFACVRGDDGATTTEWAADLVVRAARREIQSIRRNDEH